MVHFSHTDCSALTQLFCSRKLIPKFHLWALRLAEHGIALQWVARVLHHVPDELSRLTHSQLPVADIDDVCADYSSSLNPLEKASCREFTPNSLSLADFVPTGVG